MRIFEYITQGGPVMYILLLLNVTGFAIMIYKFITLSTESKNIDARAENLKHKLYPKLPKSTDTTMIIEITRQEVVGHMQTLEKGLNTIKIIASIAPLLGLLGTVVGVLIAFQVMSKTGLNNPEHFAQGISMALITTVGGLIVAIPHYVGHNYILGILDSIESQLAKNLLTKIL